MESISLSDEDDVIANSKKSPDNIENLTKCGEDVKSIYIPKEENESIEVSSIMQESPSSPNTNQNDLTGSVSTIVTASTDIMQSKNENSIENIDRSSNVSEPSVAAMNDYSTSSLMCNEKSTLVQNSSSYNHTVESQTVPNRVTSDKSETSPHVGESTQNEITNDNAEGKNSESVVSENCYVETSGKIDEETENDRVEMTNKILQLEEERGKLTTEVMEKEILVLKMEKETTSLKSEISQLESTHATKLADIEKKQKQMLDQMNAKMTELKKHFVMANKEKESMVMKYALRESDIIKEKAAREASDKKCKAAQKEKDDAVAKMKNAVADKTKLQQVADSRMQDINVLKKEIDQWKEEVKIQESKSSASSSRLKEEVDAHRITQEKLDGTIKFLSEYRNEFEKQKKENAEFMEKFKSEEDDKLKKEKEAKQEQSAKLIIDQAAADELVTVREKYNKLTEENETLNEKIEKLETKCKDQDDSLEKTKETLNSQKEEIDALLKQVAEFESCKMKLSTLEANNTNLQSEIEVLQEEMTELSTDMKSCKEKEAKLLEFTEKLTERNVGLQSDLAAAECRVSALDSEHDTVMSRAEQAESSLSMLKKDLEKITAAKKQETELLARKLAEKSKQAELLSQQTLDAKNEVQVLKRKHATSLRELTRELQIAHSSSSKTSHPSSARTLSLENNNHQPPISPNSLQAGASDSRTSSNSSLNRIISHDIGKPDSLMHLDQKTVNPVLDSPVSTSSSQSNLSYDSTSQKKAFDDGVSTPSFVVSRADDVEMRMGGKVPESHVLVDKIVKLQKTLARKQEKIEFMEEHVSTMLEEMKKKNKLIQNYILKVESGALVSSQMDENKPAAIGTGLQKPVSERKLSEHGGIMASIYSSNRDSGMTLELSLEINRKLQAVLEDTLLKNIMLKENINTLGNEIATMAGSGGKHKSKH